MFLSDFTEQSLASGEIYDKQRQEKDADDEYKTLSSVARVAHASYKYFSEGKLTSVSREGGRLILRPAADIRGTKAGEILTGWLKDPEVSERLAWMEHRRWNAYIRAQGYTRPASESQRMGAPAGIVVMACAFTSGAARRVMNSSHSA